MAPRGRGRSRLGVWTLYARAIVREFRWSLIALAVILAVGTVATVLTPFAGGRPAVRDALVSTFLLLSGNPILGPPPSALMAFLYVAYPIFGIVVGAESVVRLSLLLFSKRHGEKEWSRIMASTVRDHVVLCGVGHLGYRVLEQLVELGETVVAIEKDPENRFLEEAKVKGVTVLVADAKSDPILKQAGIERARAVIIATNDIMANLEVAVDARRMNPQIRIITRMYDAGMAKKLGDALELDVAFSSSALAAPTVAAAIFDAKVLSTFRIDGKTQLVAELPLHPQAPLCGTRVGACETTHSATVLSVRRGDGPAARPLASTELLAGDQMIVHVKAEQLAALARATRAS